MNTLGTNWRFLEDEYWPCKKRSMAPFAFCRHLLQIMPRPFAQLHISSYSIPSEVFMNTSAKSVFFFGSYISLAGLILIVAPNHFLTVLQVETTTEIWIRMFGVMAFVLGGYYMYCSKRGAKDFIQVSVYGRIVFFLFTVLFVLCFDAPKILVAFGLLDAVAALLTQWFIRQETVG